MAHDNQVPYWLVAKGVMDGANPEKDDRFKHFAARASAEVLYALLAKVLPGSEATGGGHDAVSTRPGNGNGSPGNRLAGGGVPSG